MQPGAVALSEIVDQPLGGLRRDVADGHQVQLVQPDFGLGPDALDLAHRQRPDLRSHILFVHHRDAVGLVEFAGHLGDQLVGRDADRAGQAGAREDAALDQPCQHPPAFALAARHVGEIDVDLVDASVLDQRRDLADGGLEGARELAHLVEIDRQHQRLRAQLRRLHHAHGRADAELARRVGGGGDDPAPDVVLEQRKGVGRDLAQGPIGEPLSDDLVDLAPAAADHHRQAFELWVAQQLDRREEGVHVKVGDAADQGHPRILQVAR